MCLPIQRIYVILSKTLLKRNTYHEKMSAVILDGALVMCPMGMNTLAKEQKYQELRGNYEVRYPKNPEKGKSNHHY